MQKKCPYTMEDFKKALEVVTYVLESVMARLKPTEEPKVVEATTKVVETPEMPAVEEVKSVTLVELRQFLAELSRDGKTAEVKALLKKHGYNRLSDVNENDYAGIMDEAKVLKNA